ncbi:MAG: hypothetical protein ACWA5A_10570 [Marinibacterium sp.]
MRAILILAARHGRFLLVAGLLAGIALPDLAAVLRLYLPHLVALLLFVAALRIGPRAALGGLSQARRAALLVMLYQLALPLLAIALFHLSGIVATPLALALTLMLAAPSVTGAPAFAILMGHDPAPALRLMVLGTAALPATALPVLWLTPGMGDPGAVLGTTGRLLAVIAISVGAAFVLRIRLWPDISGQARQALDGASAILLAVVVIGLMAALGPALTHSPGRVAAWCALVFTANFGLQAVAWLALRRRGLAPAEAIVAGNRNVALFLVALPASVTDPLLVFIGCYQLPMYLTPILLDRLYRRRPA